ncbi:MAG: O-fucosyltransferase family protein [Pseudomonadota bacterium]
MTTAARSLRYWEFRPDADDRRVVSSVDHYVTFDLDRGGLNNIRMAFEYAVVVAYVTRRTLVLPPRQPWYLLNFGSIHLGTAGGTTDFSDIFDIDRLARVIDTISTNEFIRRTRQRLRIPAKFENVFDQTAVPHDHAAHLKAWRVWLYEHTAVVPWNPLDTIICFPDTASVHATAQLTDSLQDDRQRVEFTHEMVGSPVMHLPSVDDHRQLGQVAAMLVSSDSELDRQIRRVLRQHVCFHPKIFELAEALLQGLPVRGFNAMHIRRNDFQYDSSRASADVSIGNVRQLLDTGKALYVATDETDVEFLDVLGEQFPVYCWRDFYGVRAGRVADDIAIPDSLVGPIEMLICACADRFVGTDLSTFSSYITRLRGYIGALDTNAYYHTHENEKPLVPNAQPDQLRGKNYLREFPVLWRDC